MFLIRYAGDEKRSEILPARSTTFDELNEFRRENRGEPLMVSDGRYVHSVHTTTADDGVWRQPTRRMIKTHFVAAV